jgi:hypothetical protein
MRSKSTFFCTYGTRQENQGKERRNKELREEIEGKKAKTRESVQGKEGGNSCSSSLQSTSNSCSAQEIIVQKTYAISVLFFIVM